jgi:hypothetical protein
METLERPKDKETAAKTVGVGAELGRDRQRMKQVRKEEKR